MHRPTAILLFMALAFTGTSRAQELQLQVTANKDVAGPNHSITYSMVVGNTGAEALSDVVVTWVRPADVSMPDMLVGDMVCPTFERCDWTVGTLDPGESRAGILTVVTDDDASEATLRAEVTASAGNGDEVTAGADVLIDATPLMRLSLAPQAGPAVPGEPFTYTLTYGNGGTENVADAELRFIVPEGTSFVSATEGGTDEGGVVAWNTGPLSTGTGGERRVTVLPDASLAQGRSIVARGEIDPEVAGEPVVGSDAVTPVRGAVPLAVDVATSQTVLLAGDLLFVTVTAANTGPERLDNVRVRFRRPGGTVSAFENFGPFTECFTNAHCDSDFGSLEPGEAASNTLVFRMSTTQTEGVVTRMPIVATAAGVGEVFLTQDFLVEASPLLRLSIAPQKGPDGAITYRITYGSVGATNLTSPTLRFDVPRGTSFTDATSGGQHDGQTVVWELGALPAFGGGSVDVTVRPDAGLADGELISAGAYIDPGIARAGVRSSSVVAFEPSAPVDVRMALDRSSVEAGGVFTATLAATNRGTSALSDASVIFHGIGQYVSTIHELTDDVSCGLVHCVWSVGRLDPGESRFASVMIGLSPLIPSGEILRLPLIVGETGRVAMQSDLLLDTTPLLRLSLNTTSGHTAPSRKLGYTLSYGNVGTRNVEQAELRLPVPDGTQFVAASGGGVLMDGAVVWNPGSLGIGRVGQVTAEFQVDGALSEGDIIVADASLNSGIATEAVVRSSAAAAIRTDAPLHLDLSVDRSPVTPRGPLTMVLTAANPGPFELNNVSVRMRKPGLDMLDLTVGLRFDCTSAGDCTWVLDGLGPGESMTAHVSIAIDSDVEPGDILHADVLAQGDGIDDVYLRRDVIVAASPAAHLSLAPGATPAAAGEPMNVALTFGNAGSDPLNDVVLRVPVPDGASFASANLGGAEQDGLVIWEFGQLEAGAGGQVILSVIPDAGLAGGSILSFEAELDTKVSGTAPLRSSGASAIGADVPLDVGIEASASAVLPPRM